MRCVVDAWVLDVEGKMAAVGKDLARLWESQSLGNDYEQREFDVASHNVWCDFCNGIDVIIFPFELWCGSIKTRSRHNISMFEQKYVVQF